MKKTLIIFSILIVCVAILIFLGKSRKANEANKPAFISQGEQTQKNSGRKRENIKKEEVRDNGLKIEILREGAGEGAKNGDNISVHYTGLLEDGAKFDSSLDRGVPFNFKLGAGEVIKGWDLGILGMKAGEKRRLTIPPALAYGERGVGLIPPHSTLIFEIELLSINK